LSVKIRAQPAAFSASRCPAGFCPTRGVRGPVDGALRVGDAPVHLVGGLGGVLEPGADRFDRARRIVLPLGPRVDLDVALVELTAKRADDLLEGLRQSAGEVAQLPQRLADVGRELPSGPARLQPPVAAVVEIPDRRVF